MRCDDCAYARWKRTAAGRLHPDKSGKCGFVIPTITLPAAFWWPGWGEREPRPAGGYIERGKDLRKECPLYTHAARDDVLKEVGPPAIEALAEAWASFSKDGLENLKRECEAWLSTGVLDRNAPGYAGSWEGYTADAEEMIRRLHARGFTVVSLKPEETHHD